MKNSNTLENHTNLMNDKQDDISSYKIIILFYEIFQKRQIKG